MPWARLEDEVVGSRLVGAPTEASSARTRNMTRCIVAILVMTMLGCSMLVLDKKEEEAAVKLETAGEVKTKKIPRKGPCGDFCKARLDQRRKHHAGDFLANDDLLQLVKKSREKSVEELKVNYGEEYFTRIFESSKGKLRETFISAAKNGPSLKRFQRKLQMKILEVQVAIHKENMVLREGCDCNRDTPEERRALEKEVNKTMSLPPIAATFSNFVWATGGHSASAGHGNYHKESYTAYMAVTAKPAFDAIGILFEGRNYGMGGMKSAPQLSLCNEAVFGTDADVLSWDFGMTDNRMFYRKALHSNRAGAHRNRPAIVDITLMGKNLKERAQDLKTVENNGLTTLRMVDNLSDQITKHLPETFGLSQEQIDQIPPYVRDFKCEGKIENGDPTCKAKKWSPGCENRKHKTSWHPGWKVNALYGSLIGLFLVDALAEAIAGLGPNSYDPATKLGELKAMEDKDYEHFFKSTIPLKSESITGNFNGSITKDIDPMMFFRNRVICRTALLPAESRYKGYMTGVVPASDGAYEKGTPNDVIGSETGNGTLRIAFDRAERQEWCPATLKIDFQDYFYASQNDGQVKMTFPNDAEIEAYGPWEPKGIITICFFMCPWGKCPVGDRQLDDVNAQLLNVTVNDVVVTRLWRISEECGVAEGKDGWYFSQNKEGRYELSVKVAPSSEALAFTRITSIMAL